MLSWLEQSVAAFHVHRRQQTVSNQHVDLDRNNAYTTIFGTYFFPQFEQVFLFLFLDPPV